ncbi:MAG: OmpA family protein [Reichenbachiella sp.]
MKKLLLLTILSAVVFLNSASVLAEAKNTDNSFKSLTQIEAALNPLEILANHGGIRRSIDLNIQFAFSSASILPAAQRQIDALGKALTGKLLNHCIIQLTGHTDTTGNADDNLALSKQRASAVKQQLVKHYNVLSSQLIVLGKGENQLIKKLSSTDAKHRRVEISLADVEQCKKSVDLPQKSQQDKISKDKEGNLKIDW